MRIPPRIVVVALLGISIVAPSLHAQDAKPSLRIAILSDGPSDAMTRQLAELRGELEGLLGAERALQFVQPKTATDWTLAQVRRGLQEVLSRRDVDVVIGVGALTGVAVGRLGKLSKPVVLPFAAPALQGLPRDGARSGTKNLTYVTGLLNIDRELRRLRDIVRFERVAFVVGKEVVEHLDNTDAPLREAAERVGVGVDVVVADNPEQALADIPHDAEAVYFGALLRWSDAEVQRLIDGINARALPSYAGDGIFWVERGALATMETAEDDVRRLRRVALYVQRIALGEDPAAFDVTFEPRPELVINMATARAIAAWPSFEVMAEARLINDTSGVRGPVITLPEAMQRSVTANLDLMAARTGVKSGRENVNEARGVWLPSADASADYTWIDPDGASAFGSAERQLRWGIQGQQLLYSPKAHGNLRAQRSQQRGVEETYQTTRLDIMLSAAEAFLNVLRAKNGERVNRNNLLLARRNLSLAETRNAVGAAGREEVYRWRIEIASSRASVIRANAERNQAEIQLNRILNRPLEAPFQTPPANDSQFAASDPRLADYVDDPWSFKVFREFMVQEALRQSPELRRIEAGIATQQELVKIEQRALGIPEVALTGGFSHIPHVAGVGSQPVDPALTGGAFPSRDTLGWRTGIAASFNIFDGTQRYARLRRARLETDRLETEQAATAQRVEQNIRASLHQAGASSAAIALTRDAADAASQNLDLVTDAYKRGAVDIIRLIDAQNQALTTELAASNAAYDFLIDLMRVERASGAFSIEGTSALRDDFFRRLRAFAEQRRGEERSRIKRKRNGQQSQEGQP